MTTLTPRISTVQSTFWRTNTGIVRARNGAILIDAGVLPQELAALPDRLDGAPVLAGLMTHAHWDHVLWAAELGRDVPRLANATTHRLFADQAARRERILTGVEAEAGTIGTWDRALLGPTEVIAGDALTIDGVEIDLVDVSGHIDGQCAFIIPAERVAFVADTLSDIEAPSFYDGRRNIGEYRATLDQLEALIPALDWIVPGHGAPCGPAEALNRLRADRTYLRALEAISGGPGDADVIANQLRAELDDDRFAAGESWEMHLSTVKAVLGDTSRQDWSMTPATSHGSGDVTRSEIFPPGTRPPRR